MDHDDINLYIRVTPVFFTPEERERITQPLIDRANAINIPNDEFWRLYAQAWNEADPTQSRFWWVVLAEKLDQYKPVDSDSTSP